MTTLAMAQRYRKRPSELLCIDDGYTAYCLDEACEYIWRQMEEGKQPFFEQQGNAGHTRPSGNAATVDLLKKWGAEVKTVD